MPMRQLLDWLRQAGHDVPYFPDIAPQATDSGVMRPTDVNDSLVLTEDNDFGDLVFRHGRSVPGIALPRLLVILGTGFGGIIRLSRRRGFARVR
jgi:predicted nuclease of predicted toxin-antitoxin system